MSEIWCIVGNIVSNPFGLRRTDTVVIPLGDENLAFLVQWIQYYHFGSLTVPITHGFKQMDKARGTTDCSSRPKWAKQVGQTSWWNVHVKEQMEEQLKLGNHEQSLFSILRYVFYIFIVVFSKSNVSHRTSPLNLILSLLLFHLYLFLVKIPLSTYPKVCWVEGIWYRCCPGRHCYHWLKVSYCSYYPDAIPDWHAVGNVPIMIRLWNDWSGYLWTMCSCRYCAWWHWTHARHALCFAIPWTVP